MAMIKVRATKDGHFGGYYRYGPVFGDDGNIPGEVFELDDTPFEVKDTEGKPVYERDEQGKPIPVMVGGKQKMDGGKPVFKVKMATWFTTEWMERVPDDTEVTNDYEPFRTLKEYRQPKQKSSAAPQSRPASVSPGAPQMAPGESVI